jgi:hypothetical protein
VKIDRAHPADDRLIAIYFGEEEAGEAERRTVRQHLLGCESCTWRYTELTAPLERLRRDAASEADEIFTAARLDQQSAAIADRIAERAHEARVVPFPNQPARREPPVLHRPFMRWVAAAAAAGLIVGVVAGRLLEPDRIRPVGAAPVAHAAKAAVTVPRLISVGPVPDLPDPSDEEMILEIEAAARSQRISALAALDQMTPHLRQDAVLARSIR